MAEKNKRCDWAQGSQILVKYHDEEWGVPQFDDRVLFEFLVLEGAQAGLSWTTVLNKRENYRRAFDGFDPLKVARFDKRKVDNLLKDEGIIRNRLKIESTIINARMLLQIREEYGSFGEYIWQFVDGAPIQNSFRSIKELPAKTKESVSMSKDLLSQGFKFVGPTICYAFMQAVGMVNDHLAGCFRYKQVRSYQSYK
jgi:DNA-3-methyladenine glycosylase I